MKNKIRIKAGCLIVIFISFLSCTKDTLSQESSDSPGVLNCGIDTTFTLTLPAVDIARYSEADTRYIPGWIGAKFKAGSAGTNYTVAIEIVTTCTGFTQKYSARALLSINNLLP